ncbi:UBC-like protein [Armillaria solidipes]|uniref:UBC-like protein n=1 Tax=Armillaria solidipes TaxID=1076256 RepID=A0A2H3C2X9_9AGAR|nr:UBC-like protein [Armillaria solidipes]
MATKAASKRLSKEYVTMQREPPPFVWAVPDKKNISTCEHFFPATQLLPYRTDNMHHGLLLFPSEYPFKPPGIKMLTRSGRFLPDKKIGFSMSDFYPGSWNPAWSVATILTGLLSFMLSDEMTTGSVTSSDTHKRTYAQRSHDAFPGYCTPQPRDSPNMIVAKPAPPPTPAVTLTAPTSQPNIV